MKTTKVLVVEDEPAIRDMVRFALPSAEFSMLEAESVSSAQQLLVDHHPDIIVLDWMLPGKPGTDFISMLKQDTLYQHIPIIMLTAKAEESHKVKGLNLGADDYIIKPFSPTELIARIRSILRRGPLLAPNNVIQFNDLILNQTQHQVTIHHNTIKLSPTEYQLLYFLLTHPNYTYSREQLLNAVWSNNLDIDERTVDAQIKRLRHRLKPYGYDQYLQTVRQQGYKWNKSL